MNIIKERLDNLNLRMTKQRQVILGEFKDPDTHLTADEVYYRVRKKIPHVSLGTIYRNLEVLSEYGLINKVELAGHQKLFDGNLKKHYHMRCVKCNKLVDVPEKSIVVDTHQIENAEKFKITDFRLEILGVCSACGGKK